MHILMSFNYLYIQNVFVLFRRMTVKVKAPCNPAV